MSKRYRKSFTFEGKRYFTSGSTPEEAERKAIKKKTELENHVKKINSPKTVSQWLDGWVDVYENGIAKKTQKHYQLILERFCDWSGDQRLDRITQRDIQMYINEQSNLTEVTIQKIKQVLRLFFETAEYAGYVTRNPVYNIKINKCKPAGQPRRRITDAERELILRVAEYHPFGTYLKIMLYCGLRTMEVAALDGRHIDLNKRVIHVRQTVKADGEIGEPKSKAGIRDVPIPDALIPDLNKLDLQPYEPAVKYYNARQGYVRYDHNGVANSWASFKDCMRTEGVFGADLVMYDLRHTYCTDLQDAGVPINIARELMGHANINMTVNIYTHRSEESISKARELINQHQNEPCQNRATGLKIVGK